MSTIFAQIELGPLKENMNPLIFWYQPKLRHQHRCYPRNIKVSGLKSLSYVPTYDQVGYLNVGPSLNIPVSETVS